jgi:hypothetical protein
VERGALRSRCSPDRGRASGGIRVARRALDPLPSGCGHRPRDTPARRPGPGRLRGHGARVRVERLL